MSLDKMELLFGAVPPWADPDDPDDRSSLLSAELRTREGAAGAFTLALYETVANQVVDEDPPAVWATAQRLLALGLDRRQVLQNLALALNAQLLATLGGQTFDAPAYAAALDRLPLPTAADVEAAMVAVVRERQPIEADELEALVSSRLGLPIEEPYRSLLDEVSDRAMDHGGPLAILAGDRVVMPEALCTGIVLTHRLTSTEQATDRLGAGVDLAGFARRLGPLRTNIGCELETEVRDEGDVVWRGPEGWLRRYEAGAVLAVRADGDTVAIDVLDREPPPDATLTAALRSAYDTEFEEPELPVAIEDLLFGVLTGDRRAFAAPRPPLSALCEAAGLEVRGSQAAHDESIWDNERRLHRLHRVMDRLEDRDDRLAAIGVLDCFEDQAPSHDQLRQSLAALRSPEVLEVVADEMFGFDDDVDRLEQVAVFSEQLLAAARRPREVAVARWLGAAVAERRGDPLAGEAQLQLAVAADSRWGPAVDRLAWYRSDRGDAAEAVRLWQSLGFDPEQNEDLAIVQPFASPPGPKPGRNDPCWCGSGRKFKVCHLDQPVVTPLPDRVRWLCRKAAAYLERRGGGAAPDVYALASARAGGRTDDALSEALDDPIVIDVALHELGWLDRFLAERGPLLPEDEALLAASWVLTDRTVYQIVESDPGVGVVVEDLRTAERLAVRERTFSHQAQPAMLVCGRAVPDGETHQFIGTLFVVPPGTEAELLDLLDEGDAFELLEYVAALERPPTLITREGEPLLDCTALLDVPDPGAARSVLDRRYERDMADTWAAVRTLEEGDDVVHATLRLSSGRITVKAMSERRLDRVVAGLLDEISGARVTVRELRPFGIPDRARQPAEPPPVPSDDPELQAALDSWLDRQEIGWCDERIPALAGVTPRQAAADPTRREALERLLASFDAMNSRATAEGAITMRPARLRRLLGLDS